MIVSIDLDGVLADFSAGAFTHMKAVLSEKNGEEFSPPYFPPRRWNWSDFGASQLDVNEMWKRIKLDENFYYNLFGLPGILDLRVALHNGAFLEHDLVFVTSRVDTRGPSAKEQTELWLEEKLGLHRPTVYVVPRQTSKPELLRSLEVHAHLDDFPPTIQCSNHFCDAVLLQQPWNARDLEGYWIRSVPSVRRFLEYLEVWL